MATQDLTRSQLSALTITERTTSALSLLGFAFVVYTYWFSPNFKKPVNRLIFYAQWSNLGTTLVGFIARDALHAGASSPLCQFQAFMFQMFGGVDVYWALCMSLNVYLALFHGWTAKRMEKQEWKYLTACYGISLSPAVVYLFVNTASRGRVYGPAILWCWIAPSWSFLRIATLYAIVWCALLIAFGIYCIALAKAWRHRRALAGLLNPLNENPFAGTSITTEIEVVFSKDGDSGNEERIALGSRTHFDRLDDQEQGRNHSVGGGGKSRNHSVSGSGQKDPYTVVVAGTPYATSTRPELLRLPTLTRNAALAEENAEAWLYARVAFLYFLAMIICWIPASINRLVSVIYPEKVIFGLNYVAIVGLPLQGFLNAMVYCVSSQTAIKNMFKSGGGHTHTRTRIARKRSTTKDAQRIRDSYSPRVEDGGAISHGPPRPLLSRQGSAPVRPPRPEYHRYHPSGRFASIAKTEAEMSVESVSSFREGNAHPKGMI